MLLPIGFVPFWNLIITLQQKVFFECLGKSIFEVSLALMIPSRIRSTKEIKAGFTTVQAILEAAP